MLTSYLVSNAIVLPVSGWFSMLFGRKRFYMSASVLFTLSSSALRHGAHRCRCWSSFASFRGSAAAALQPISQAILVDSFPRQKQGMAMAVYGMGVVVAPVDRAHTRRLDHGQLFSWRWIFFINVPVGIISLLMISLLIH